MSKAYVNYQRKRELISLVAWELFSQKGFSVTSMDDVAKAANVTKQTVYRYFPSKLELFKAVLESYAQKAPKNYNFGQGDLAEELYGFAMHFMRFHISPEYLGTMRLLVSEARENTELGAIFYANGPKKSGAMLSTFLRERISGIADADHAASLFVAMLHHVRTPLLLGLCDSVTEEELDKHARYSVDIFLHGCMSKV
ncbi:TetR/AcrR family transcriptional regulator [Maridesulfovibrio sp.]|uniref:TetR/AcrR family transcriptional regulator n=1 Tax=Maridesulfovibrio sp. TaxID=2795000 RepID=UPI0029CA975A|nr:TetR/AcrR family transcriptional regulator [Maridesulfovibrio sp.]